MIDLALRRPDHLGNLRLDGPLGRRPPEGEVYHSIESPKGELGYYIVSDGKTQNAYRCHVRPPSFVNLQALPALARGHLVSDLVALIGTIDIVLGEVDR